MLWLLGLAAALCYTLGAALCVARFPFGYPPGYRQERREWPSISVLKPMRGVEPLEALRWNLGAMLDQDYPGKFEVLFGFQDVDDPALDFVERLCLEFPNVATNVVIPGAPGPNRKASVLAALECVARGDILVVSDQDMRVDRHYLRSVAVGFDDPAAGVVTCPYRSTRAPSLGAVFEALAVTDFVASVLVARSLEGMSFALGATMAVRRSCLDAIGGFAALQPYLADDYELGNRALRSGAKVVLSPYVVENVLPRTSLVGFFKHQLRWARGYRVCRPVGYFCSVLMNGTVFALGLVSVTGGAPWAWQALGAWVSLRVGATFFAHVRLGGTVDQLLWMLLLPVKDLMGLALWFLALVGDTVEWGGTEYLLHADGTMTPL